MSEADTRQTLGLGVLDDMSLLARLDMEFEISIPAADFFRWMTLGDMVALVDHVRNLM